MVDVTATVTDATVADFLSKNNLRFVLELEFIQCLSNPLYLSFLSQHIGFTPALINYISYLQYWKTPKYAIYVTYPYSLQILDALMYKEFRDLVGTEEGVKRIHSIEYLHWQTYSKDANDMEVSGDVTDDKDKSELKDVDGMDTSEDIKFEESQKDVDV